MLFVGDVHGNFNRLREIVEEHTAEHDIVQVGDLGFNLAWNSLYDFELENELGIIGGNHENYDVAADNDFYLGDYGTICHMEKRFWFCRGGHSLDRNIRQARELAGNVKTYWHEEELDFKELGEALHSYRVTQPDIVVTHAAPVECVHEILAPPAMGDFPRRMGYPLNWHENTSLMLQQALELHRPKLWIFGHYHKAADYVKDGTRFVCLEELQTLAIGDEF